MATRPVVVFGATGFTGRLVVESLMELGMRDVILGGRSAERLGQLAEEHGGLEFRIADAGDPEALRKLVRGAHVVIDTAGPFVSHGEAVVQAALDSRVHFLDTTGEQAYMLSVLHRFHGAAKERRVAVVNAQAFEFALGCCLGALLAESDTSMETVDVFYRVERFKSTRGTQKSILEALARDVWVRKNGQLKTRGPSPVPMKVRFPESERDELGVPIPGGEALHLARAHPHIRNTTTNAVLPTAVAAAMMAFWTTRPIYRRLHDAGATNALIRRIESGPEGPNEAERQNQRALVMARAKGPCGTATAVARTVDPYGITGFIAAVGARMLVDGEPRSHGVLSPDQAFGAKTLLDALTPYGVQVQR